MNEIQSSVPLLEILSVDPTGAADDYRITYVSSVSVGRDRWHCNRTTYLFGRRDKS